MEMRRLSRNRPAAAGRPADGAGKPPFRAAGTPQFQYAGGRRAVPDAGIPAMGKHTWHAGLDYRQMTISLAIGVERKSTWGD